jgi:iron complex outermembrane receptor protein
MILGSFVPAARQPRTTKTSAAFVDGTWSITERFSLLAGVRRSKDTKDVTAYDGVTGVKTDARSGDWSSTTARTGMRYQWTDSLMTYATVSEGFRGGGFNYDSSSGQFFEFDPEKQRSYEVGARMDLLEHRLRLNPTVFYAQWEDIQVQSVVPTSQGVLIVLDNAANAHIYGFELEAEAAVTDSLRIYGTLATLKMQYDDIGAATGITVDSKFQRAPELTWSIGADYTLDFSSGADLVTTLGWSSQDRQNSTPTDADALILPSYELLSARVAYTSAGRHWSAAAYGTNLTNEIYYVGGVNYAANVGTAHYDLGRPREYGVSIRYSF